MFKPLFTLYFKHPTLYFYLIALSAFYFVSPHSLLNFEFYQFFIIFIIALFAVRSTLIASVETAIIKYSNKKNWLIKINEKEIRRIWNVAFALYSANLLFLVPLRLIIPSTALRMLVLIISIITISIFTAKRLHAKEILSVERYLWLHVRSVALIFVFPLMLLLLLVSIAN